MRLMLVLLASTAITCGAAGFCAGAAVVHVAHTAEKDPMPDPFGPLFDRSHEIVLGQPGTGKTTYVRGYIAPARRVVFFSPTRDYRNDGDVMTPDEFEREARTYMRSTNLRVSVVAGIGDAEPREEIGQVIDTLRTWCPRTEPVVLVCDEVGDYSDGDGGKELARLHRNGHHDGIASILVSQCAVDIPLTCRRTATRVASFLQSNVVDLKALEAQYGDDFSEAVRRWQPGEPPVTWTLPTLYQPQRR